MFPTSPDSGESQLQCVDKCSLCKLSGSPVTGSPPIGHMVYQDNIEVREMVWEPFHVNIYTALHSVNSTRELCVTGHTVYLMSVHLLYVLFMLEDLMYVQFKSVHFMAIYLMSMHFMFVHFMLVDFMSTFLASTFQLGSFHVCTYYVSTFHVCTIHVSNFKLYLSCLYMPYQCI